MPSRSKASSRWKHVVVSPTVLLDFKVCSRCFEVSLMKLSRYHDGRLYRLAPCIPQCEFMTLSHQHSRETEHATLPCQICLQMLVADPPLLVCLNAALPIPRSLGRFPRSQRWFPRSQNAANQRTLRILRMPSFVNRTPYSRLVASCGAFWICIR
jgi:hypothetical protein